jgi:hypothetical protein
MNLQDSAITERFQQIPCFAGKAKSKTFSSLGSLCLRQKVKSNRSR